LTTSSVLLWQLDGDSLLNGSDIALKGSEQCTTTINNDEAELFIVLKQVVKTL
jgi:hypothetical protein